MEDLIQFVDNSPTSVDWPKPEPLQVALRPVRKMPSDLLPEGFRGWIEDIVEHLGCPIESPAVAALIASGAVVGSRIRIRPNADEKWLLTPNLWGLIVGRPGAKKTPVVNEVLQPMRCLEEAARKEYARKQEDWKYELLRLEVKKKQHREQIDKVVRAGDDDSELRLQFKEINALSRSEPVLRRYIVNDSTVEKLGELLNQNPRGLLLYRDELIGFLSKLHQADREADRAFYVESWNGDGVFTYDRIGRGTIHIKHLTLSVLGNIPPSPLAKLISQVLNGLDDDGLIQRFQLMVYPDSPSEPYRTKGSRNKEAEDRAYRVFRRLDGIDPTSLAAKQNEKGEFYLQFDAEAQQCFDNWLEELETELRKPEPEHHVLESHRAKYRSLMPKLALLFHLIKYCDIGKHQSYITAESASCAAAWCTLLWEHAQRIYGLAISPEMEKARILLDQIVKGKLSDPFTFRMVSRHQWTGLSTKKDVEQALELLEDYGWVRSFKLSTGGRPSVQYWINPLIRRNSERLPQ